MRQCCFSRTGMTDDGPLLAPFNFKIDIGKDLIAAETY